MPVSGKVLAATNVGATRFRVERIMQRSFRGNLRNSINDRARARARSGATSRSGACRWPTVA
jgi:hypothetical protein